MSAPEPTAVETALEAGLKDTLEQLERCRAQGKNPQKRCNYCRAFRSAGALCLDCNDRRLELKERFQKQHGGSNA